VVDLHRKRLLVNPVRITTSAILVVASAATLGFRNAVREGNPRQLRAMQLLDRRTTGLAPRVRFEWDPVSGARRYVLTGRWTSPPSWTVQSASYSVSPRNADVWDPHRVALELSVAEGANSWSVVALFGPDEHGDFAHPTGVSFDLR
jgi:hypothetical protein